jgi:hypothetical protein
MAMAGASLACALVAVGITGALTGPSPTQAKRPLTTDPSLLLVRALLPVTTPVSIAPLSFTAPTTPKAPRHQRAAATANATVLVAAGTHLNLCQDEGKSKKACAPARRGLAEAGERVTVLHANGAGWYQLRNARGEEYWGFAYYIILDGKSDAKGATKRWGAVGRARDSVPVFADAALRTPHGKPILEDRLPLVARPALKGGAVMAVMQPSGLRGYVRTADLSPLTTAAAILAKPGTGSAMATAHGNKVASLQLP